MQSLITSIVASLTDPPIMLIYARPWVVGRLGFIGLEPFAALRAFLFSMFLRNFSTKIQILASPYCIQNTPIDSSMPWPKPRNFYFFGCAIMVTV
jgi:hypothetical protein